MTRMPVVAGSFYEGNEQLLLKRLENCFLGELGPHELPSGQPGNIRKIKAIISPHAGYIYSGMTAANNFLRLFQDGRPEHIVIIGPNHTGYGNRIAICEEDWQTPLGIVKYDRLLGGAIIQENEHVTSDCIAHSSEHSIEVQLPFLQYIFGEDVSFVPMCVREHRYDALESIGKTLAKLAKEMDILIIASSDFTHFEPADIARMKDEQAIEYLQFLDPKGFLEYVVKHRVSICGVAPITIATVFAKERGATEFNIIKYTNSGDITGDKSSVVTYVSAEFL